MTDGDGARSEAATRTRIDAIDLARGLALVAMAVYHFAWDLEFFGYADPGMTQQGGWKIFARCIASSFLFLVGVSLVLAHGNGVRWVGFGKRLLQVGAAAALITIATWFATPDRFIFFGILHQIALASVIGLLFVRLPPLLTLATAIAIIAAPYFLSAELFAYPVFWWVGLAPLDPPSNDYVPVFPWTGAVLAGIAAARIGQRYGVFARLAPWRSAKWMLPFNFSGRHGLAFYLLHQPMLIGCLWLFAQMWPATTQTPEYGFMLACERNCAASGIDCPRYCACVLDGIDAAGRLDDVFSGVSDTTLDNEIAAIAGQCRQLDGE